MDFVWSREFQKRYQKLPKRIQVKFQERLERFVANGFDPILNNHQLSGQYTSHRSINITGDYRAIYRDVGPRVIKWVTIGTHGQLYG